MEYTISDTFDVSAERYWEVFFSTEYNAALWPHLDIDCEVLEFEKKGDGKDLVIERCQRLTPRREVPAILKKLVKGAITYTEKNSFKATLNRMDTVTTPSFGADRIDNHGAYRLVEDGPEKVTRIWDGFCSCKIPLLGGKVEKFLVSEIEDSYRRATEFTRQWHKSHPA